ncbi:iron chelate uptake ABC transporter family permease subunit [Paracoccus aerius]
MADRSLLILAAACAGAAAVYVAWGLQGPYGFILSLRATRLAALAIVGASVGAATVIFQTITANRLLTPGIVGFDRCSC